MKVGIFDHLDRNDLPLRDFYEERLMIAEAYDKGGFYSYHSAEHHATPLGLASSPSVFLAALAQRTRTLRFGPLVYTLPLHHPLRLAEEICMLDQMSGGRLDLGVGRGISPIETAYYGVDPENRQAMFVESLAVLRQALSSRKLTFHGRFYNFTDVPIELEPLQKPHPPLWVGLSTPDGAAVAGAQGLNVVANALTTQVRVLTDRYREAWTAAHPGAVEMPLIGLGRFVILGRTDDEALTVARRAYPRWHAHFHHLYRQRGETAVLGDRPPEFDQIKDGGRGIAGSPTTVARMIREQVQDSGANYFVGQFAFGDLTLAEILRTVDLFVSDVAPALRDL